MAEAENDNYDVLGMIPKEFHKRLFVQLQKKFEPENQKSPDEEMSKTVSDFIKKQNSKNNDLGGKNL